MPAKSRTPAIGSTTVTLAQALHWGAGRYLTEARMRKVGGGKDHATFDWLLANSEPRIVFWLLARENFMTARAMHEAAHELTDMFLSRLEKQKTYVDFRCRRLLAVKERWLAGEISLGELRNAQHEGAVLRTEIAAIEILESIAAAEAAWFTLHHEGREALGGVFHVLDRLEDDEDSRRSHLERIMRHASPSAAEVYA